jgi:hypothetical protein
MFPQRELSVDPIGIRLYVVPDTGPSSGKIANLPPGRANEHQQYQ